MNADVIASVFLSIVAVAFATTLVLPGRQTANITREGLNGFATVLGSAEGR